MVRINIINPRKLTDQHLVAEYNEILMLFGYVKKFPQTSLNKIPQHYCLGKGHILFFKNKLLYLKKRHEDIKEEMLQRNFLASKTITLTGFSNHLCKDWKPQRKDLPVIKKRLIEKIRQKPGFYTYYREKKSIKFLIKILQG